MATSFVEAQAIIDKFVERAKSADARRNGDIIFRYSSAHDNKTMRQGNIFKKILNKITLS